MKTIGITAGNNENKNSVNNAYIKTFTTDKIVPMIIPMFEIKSSEVFTVDAKKYIDTIAESICSKCDALVLTGGNDINPVGMGNTFVGSTFTNYNRDIVEMALVEQFIKMNKPVIGICRGFQVLGMMYGLKLTQELMTVENQNELHNGNSVELPARDEPAHEIEICGDFLEWSKIKKMKVNSWHHQGFLLRDNKIDKELRITEGGYYLEDGKGAIEVIAKTSNVIEGFRHRKLPMVAFQFHPEEYDDSWTIQYIIEKYLT